MCAFAPDGRVAFVQSRVRQREGWGLPGGFVRGSESFADAAAREFREESGLEVAGLRALSSHIQPWSRHIETLFVGQVATLYESPSTAPLEVRSVDWFNVHELSDMRLTVEMHYLINNYLGEDFQSARDLLITPRPGPDAS